MVQLKKPVFLTGCGRSGTTILGLTLAQHPSITSLNEPREIWHSVYPETDVWSAEASHRQGQLYLTGGICTPQRNRQLHKLFYREIQLRGKPQLVEKLPENNFRLKFIHAIFPDALFLHIIRNGIEVALSIERACKDSEWSEARWYGANEYKWNQIVKYTQGIGKYQKLPGLCLTDYDRGLLEWRLSVEAALEFFQSIPRSKYLQITYENLVRNPMPVLKQIEDFIGLQPSQDMYIFANTNIERKSTMTSDGNVPESTELIASDLLKRLRDYVN